MCAETQLEQWNQGMEFLLRWSAALEAATHVRSSHTKEAGSHRKLEVTMYCSCLLGHPSSSASPSFLQLKG